MLKKQVLDGCLKVPRENIMERCCTVAAAGGEQSDSHLNDSSDTTVPTATNMTETSCGSV